MKKIRKRKQTGSNFDENTRTKKIAYAMAKNRSIQLQLYPYRYDLKDLQECME